MVKSFGIIAFAAVIAILAACNNPANGGTTNGGQHDTSQTAPILPPTHEITRPVDVAFTYSLPGTAGNPVAAWTYTGTMPPGLTLNGRIISGTPTTAGTTVITVTAANVVNSSSTEVTINITPDVVTCTHVWGDWARVSPGDHTIQQTIRTCTVTGCNEQQTFIPGGVNVQASLTVPGVFYDKEMVRIPAGSIMGGWDGITQSHDFWMSRHQVTRVQWHYVMGSLPWGGAAADADNRAASHVSWYDALVFANKLSMRTPGLTPAYEIRCAINNQWTTDTSRWGTVPASNNARWNEVRIAPTNPPPTGYRLPTSAQWEYAARAGTTTEFNDGVTNDWQNTAAIREIAWFRASGALDNPSGVQPVGQLHPNAWGLYDMHGNVWEWCWDASGALRVIRGGSWFDVAVIARSSVWFNVVPWEGWSGVGFRLVRP